MLGASPGILSKGPSTKDSIDCEVLYQCCFIYDRLPTNRFGSQPLYSPPRMNLSASTIRRAAAKDDILEARAQMLASQERDEDWSKQQDS
ncbi:MAG: hypothetical protein FRX49_07581 [Trebouxia sp. A1-2]|nr:MAG: hypothetical protein FRX49_07581 [Trebouxia sp. A1-2]